MTPLLLLAVFLLCHLPGTVWTVTTIKELTVLEGQSVTVPCHYDSQYMQNVKYWCQGSMKEFCSTVVRSDDPNYTPHGNSRVTIADDPTQHVFTVTMHDLKEANSGWYWCMVEIGNMWSVDSSASAYITVKHGLSAVNSMVSGEEGGSVSVQCLYSEKHRTSDKKWCRSGLWSSCKVTDSNGTFNSESLLISDDKKSTFTVTMRNLEIRDAGWYWCEAGQHQVAVQVLITTRPTTTPSVTTAISLTTQHLLTAKAQDSKSPLFGRTVLIVCGSLLLLLTAVFVPWRIREQCKKKPKKRGMEETETKLMVYPMNGRDGDNASLIYLNCATQQVHML